MGDLRRSLKLGHMRSHDLGLPFLHGCEVSKWGTQEDEPTGGRYAAYVLQVREDILADTILIEFAFYACDNIVYDGTVYRRLMSCTIRTCRGTTTTGGTHTVLSDMLSNSYDAWSVSSSPLFYST